MRSRLMLLVAAALVAVTLPQPARALPLLPFVVSGTIQGSDARAVSALIGFDLHDAEGRQITADGCVESSLCPVEGYAISTRINRDLDAQGSPRSRDWVTRWSIEVPANTASVYFEVYPQAKGFGGTDKSRYGSAMRHKVKVPHKGPIHLRLPLARCDLGGRTGVIEGAAFKGGKRVPIARSIAWSLGPNNNNAKPILGWNVEHPQANGSYRLPALASGQPYQVWITLRNGQQKRIKGVRVEPCATTRLDVRF